MRVLAGFHWRWRITSHRVPIVEFTLFDEPRASLEIGAFPEDRATITIDAVGCDALAHGSIDLDLSGRIGHSVHGRAAVAVPPPPPGHCAVLAGLSVRAQHCAPGWHLGRLAASVELDGDSVVAGISLRPSEAPEPLPFGTRPWTFDLPATHRCSVHWAIVPAGPAVAWAGELPEAVEDSLRGPAAPGPHALTAFDIEFDSPVHQVRNRRLLRYLTGRYLREFGVGISSEGPWACASNLPSHRALLRLAFFVFVAATGAGAGFLMPSVPGLLLAAIFGGALTALVRWPGGPACFPVTPWRMHTSVAAVAVAGVPERARAQIRSAQVPPEAPLRFEPLS